MNEEKEKIAFIPYNVSQGAVLGGFTISITRVIEGLFLSGIFVYIYLFVLKIIENNF